MYKIFGAMSKDLHSEICVRFGIHSVENLVANRRNRWLVETPSRDVYHYRMINASGSTVCHYNDKRSHNDMVIMRHFQPRSGSSYFNIQSLPCFICIMSNVVLIRVVCFVVFFYCVRLISVCHPRESEGLCFYRRWFVCLSVCLFVCLLPR